MNIIGIGIDIVETARIESMIERHGDRFLERVFTPAEIEYCKSMKCAAPYYAARFAVKEAVSKAFGTGIGASVAFKEVEVRRTEQGRPFVVLHGAAKQCASNLKVTTILISISHSDHYAVANALAVSG